MDRRPRAVQRLLPRDRARFDFDDALLIDIRGNVVYSAYKGVDLGTNILNGPYRDSELRRTFEERVATNTVDYVAVTDFSKFYQPADNEPTAWMMAPIGPAGRADGVLALQFPITKINKADDVRQALGRRRHGPHR